MRAPMRVEEEEGEEGEGRTIINEREQKLGAKRDYLQ